MDEQRAADVFCSRWPKKNRRVLDAATHNEKVSLVSQLVASVQQNSVERN